MHHLPAWLEHQQTLQHYYDAHCQLTKRNREQQYKSSSVMEAWDASLPTLWASLSHMSHNTAAFVPNNLCISTHQSQESDARTGKSSNVQVIGYPVLKEENTEVTVFLFVCFFASFKSNENLQLKLLPLWFCKHWTGSYHKLFLEQLPMARVLRRKKETHQIPQFNLNLKTLIVL